MCRYGMHTYKQHYACFNCRKVFRKQHWESPHYEGPAMSLPPVCPNCGSRLRAMGFDFKAPKSSDVRQWRLVEAVLRAGLSYEHCGCGISPRPRNKWELAELERERAARQRRI